MTSKGYQVPDPIDPGELACFRVYVPKHTWYIGAFWAAYEFFTTWIAWARDPLKKGKQAAAVWRVAYDRARAEYDVLKGECVDMITGIRQNPLNPCELQIQTDGGAWTKAADFSCCGGGGGGACVPPLRVGTDGAIESYDPETGEWSDTAPGITPANGENYPVVYPGDPEAQCKAANGYYEFLKDTLEQILSYAAEAGSWGAYAVEVMKWLALYFQLPGVIFNQLLTLLDLAYTYSSQDTADRIAARDDADFFCEVFRRTGGDGMYTEERLAALEADLRALADAESNINIKWWYVHAADLVNIMGLTGANKGASYRVATPVDCDTCEWVATIDFTKTTGGFTTPIVPPPAFGNGARWGKWTAGEGWRTMPNGPAGNPYHNLLRASMPTDTFTLKGIKLYCYIDPAGLDCYDTFPHPPGMDGYEIRVEDNFSNTGGPVGGAFPYNCDFGPHEFDSGVITATWNRISLNCGIGELGYNPGPAGVVVTKLEVRGVGFVPPELVNFIGE